MGAALWLASATAGVISRGVVHPLDTIRTVQMTSAHALTLRSTLSRIISSDGLRGLYRGFGASLLLHAPAISIYLSVYERTRDALPPEYPRILTHAASGFVAEAASAVVWAPLETIKQRAQVRSTGGSAVVLRELLQREGPRALLSGYNATLVVFAPYAMLYFVVYERCRQEARDRYGRESNGTVAASAACAGAVAAGITTPLDVVKTRIQTQGDMWSGGAVKRRKYTGMIDAIRSIGRTEGMSAFSRGMAARMLWMMPGTAITMTTFEFLKRAMGETPPSME